jgi:hypothetical protein
VHYNHKCDALRSLPLSSGWRPACNGVAIGTVSVRLSPWRTRSTLFLPPGQGRHPALFIVSGGGGGIGAYRGAMLATHGYAELNLTHFAIAGLPRGIVKIPLEYCGVHRGMAS